LLARLSANKQEEGVVTLASGLQYKVLNSGPEGGLSPKVSSPCECHYRGYLIDGVTEFDSSYKRGQPTTFAPNQVIKGWTEAMQVRSLTQHITIVFYLLGFLCYLCCHPIVTYLTFTLSATRYTLADEGGR
jgi:hypothetical protein